MKRYIVRGGYTIYEMYEISVEANNEKDAIKKAEKLPIEKWKNFEQENGGDFAIDDIWEDDNE